MSQMSFQPETKLPQLLQSVQAESGAVALGIVLALYGKSCCLSELCIASGVTRDGTNPKKLLHAAEHFGLTGDWKISNNRLDIKNMIEDQCMPLICVDESNCYFVVLNIKATTVEIYDTRLGRLQKSLDQIVANQILVLSPSRDFHTSDALPYWRSCLQLALPLKWEFIALVLLATVSVIPILMIAACSSQFIDQFLEQRRLSFGVPIVWLALIALSLKVAMSLTSDVLLRRMSYVLERRMADDVFETLFTRSSSFLERRDSGDMASRLMYPYLVPGSAIFAFLSPALGLWTSTLIVIFSAFISIPLFLFVLTGFIAILIASYRVTVSTSDNLTILQKSNSSRFSIAFQMINNLESLKSDGIEFNILNKWHSFFAEGVQQNLSIGKQKVIRNVSIDGSIFVTQALLLGVGGILIIQGSVSLGSLLAFLFIQDQIAESLFSIPAISNGWQSLQGKLLLHDDLKQAEVDVWHKPFERTRSDESDEYSDSFEIELVDVAYRFSHLDQPVLSDINCTIKNGMHVLLRGESGSGKTLFMQLLSGLRHPSEGTQMLNGTSISEIDSNYWHRNVVYLGEDIPLFDGTILENITCWRSNCSTVDVIKVSSVVGLTHWIRRFERGFEHHLVNPNQILCNSQKIQLGIARILCGKPRIALIDVNTAELRSEDEKRIYNFCRDEGISLVSLSERSAHHALYDQILFLQRGKLL